MKCITVEEILVNYFRNIFILNGFKIVDLEKFQQEKFNLKYTSKN